MEWLAFCHGNIHSSASMMRFVIIYLMMLSLAPAEFEVWTDKTGRTAEMELVSVAKSDKSVTASFRTKDGKLVKMNASLFSSADSDKIAAWKEDGSMIKATLKRVWIPTKASDLLFDDELNHPGLKYSFHIDGLEPLFLKKMGIVAPSCSLSKVSSVGKDVYDSLFSQEYPTENEIKKKRWVLDDVSRFETQSMDSQGDLVAPGLRFVLYLKNEELFTEEQAAGSTMKATVAALKGTTLKEGEIKFSTKEVLPFSFEKTVKKPTIKTLGDFQIIITALPDDLVTGPASKPTHFEVKINEPYEPSAVQSTQILCDGKEITRLSEAKGSDITLKITYWSDLKEVKILCEK